LAKAQRPTQRREDPLKHWGLDPSKFQKVSKVLGAKLIKGFST